jgi:hypothetical protein
METNSLIFVSQGGMKYVSQVENEVSNIFALNEGIILEFNTRQMLDYSEIRDRQAYRSPDAMEVEAKVVLSSLLSLQSILMSASIAILTTSSGLSCSSPKK